MTILEVARVFADNDWARFRRRCWYDPANKEVQLIRDAAFGVLYLGRSDRMPLTVSNLSVGDLLADDWEEVKE